ncbi:MAG: VWA domain-containing protein, partial [Elusimicrobia bacterium]|nr:VWA domain-containing protein [Elusimicrobiota bacterium]
GVFTPEIYPYTRYDVFDRYDEFRETAVRSAEPSPPLLQIPSYTESELKAILKELGKTHKLYLGNWGVDLSDGRWHVLPSAGAGMEILDIQARDVLGNRVEMDLILGKDKADNFYIQAGAGGENGKVQILYRVAVPKSYQGWYRVSENLSFQYPPLSEIPPDVREAMEEIGLSGNEDNFREVLDTLVYFFSDFTLEADGISYDKRLRYLNIIHSKCGVCRHRAMAFFRTALAIGMDARYVENEIHAFVEVAIPGMDFMRINLDGGGDPMNMDLSPLAEERDTLPPDQFRRGENYRRNQERYAQRMRKAMEKQGIRPQYGSRGEDIGEEGGEESRGSGESGMSGGEGKSRKESDQRFEDNLKSLGKEKAEDIQLNDKLAALFQKGRGDTEFVFRRILRALRSRVGEERKLVSRGLEVDPVAFMLRKVKQFVLKKKVYRIQKTAVMVLLDFSGSMEGVKEQLAYTVATVGTNFRWLREAVPQHFFYDLSHFTEELETGIGLGERITEEENSSRLVQMANKIGIGGTNILSAMKIKLKDFSNSPDARNSKVKYIILFTDGADERTISNGRYTPEFAKLMEDYTAIGIDVIAIGIGQGAKDVEAFRGFRQHFVKIDNARPEDIPETIAKISEHKLMGSGLLPPGDITEFLQIGEIRAPSERRVAKSLLNSLWVGTVWGFLFAVIGQWLGVPFNFYGITVPFLFGGSLQFLIAGLIFYVQNFSSSPQGLIPEFLSSDIEKDLTESYVPAQT